MPAKAAEKSAMSPPGPPTYAVSSVPASAVSVSSLQRLGRHDERALLLDDLRRGGLVERQDDERCLAVLAGHRCDGRVADEVVPHGDTVTEVREGKGLGRGGELLEGREVLRSERAGSLLRDEDDRDLLLVGEPCDRLDDLRGLGVLGQERGVVVLLHLGQATGVLAPEEPDCEPDEENDDGEQQDGTGAARGSAGRVWLGGHADRVGQPALGPGSRQQRSPQRLHAAYGGGMRFVHLGFAPDAVDYLEGWQTQREVHAQVVDGALPDTTLLLEHAPVYTAGKRTEPHERPVDGTRSSTSTAAARSPGTDRDSSSATPSCGCPKCRSTSSPTFGGSRRS